MGLQAVAEGLIEEEEDRNMESILGKGQKAAIIAGFTTLFFALAKGVVGFFSGSVVLLADAVHSGADSFSTFFAWLGLKIAQKKPTEKFPYGYYKAENIASLLTAVLILFAGYEIVKEGINKIFIEYQLNIPLIAVTVAALDALVMFSIGNYEVKIGKKINSQSLISDGTESKMHIFSSSIVLVGLFSSWFGVPYMEGIMGILISFFIFKVGIESVKDSLFALMDVSPSKEMEEKIKKILRGISGLRDFDNLKLRKSGPFVFGEVEIKIGKNVNIKRASEISSIVEREIKKRIKTIDSFLVTISSYQTKKQKLCIPIKEGKDLDSKISNHFGRAEKFIFIELESGKIRNYYLKDNPYREKEIRAGLDASLFVIKEKIDSIITKEMGPISLHTLRDNIVDVYKGEGLKVRKIIENFSAGKLKILKEATREKT